MTWPKSIYIFEDGFGPEKVSNARGFPVSMASVPMRSIIYCGVCTLPLEYCMFTANPSKCKVWLYNNFPDLYELSFPSSQSQNVGNTSSSPSVDETTQRLKGASLVDKEIERNVPELHEEEKEDSKTRQTRGGKAMLKDESKKIEKEELKRKKAKITIKKVDRTKRKSVTHVSGLEVFGLDLKKVAKSCASRYACGCSVVRNPAGFDEVVIQGDFVDDLFDFILQEWPEILESQIEIIEK